MLKVHRFNLHDTGFLKIMAIEHSNLKPKRLNAKPRIGCDL